MTKFFKFYTFLFLLLFSSVVSAQTEKYGLKGKVIDAATSEVIPFASVVLSTMDEKTIIQGTFTDEDGMFSLSPVAPANYMFVVSFLGYKEFKTKVTPETLKKSGGAKVTVKLSEDAVLLNAVEVVGSRSQLQMDVDKKTFIVSESAMTAGVSATEILRDIPTVDVDLEGKISLRNNENVEVFINGKSVGLTADTQSDLLEQFPAGTIEKIEVITNPSSKFSADGSAGIINIVLKKGGKPGIFGVVNGGLTHPYHGHLGGNAGLSLTITKGKWTFLSALGYQRRTMHSTSNINRENYITNGESIDTSFILTNSERDFVNNSFFARLSADCQINENNNVGIAGIFSPGTSRREEQILYNYGDIAGERIYNISSIREIGGIPHHEKYPRKMFSLKFNYDHIFSDKSTLTFQTQYSSNNMQQRTQYEQLYYYDNEGIDDIESLREKEEIIERQSKQRQESNRGRNLTQFSLDYDKQVNDLSKVEVGLSADMSADKNKVQYTERIGGVGNLELSPGLSSDFDFKQNVYSFYGMWSQQYKRISYKVGLRGELTDVSWEDHEANMSMDKKPYGSLFPSLYLSFKATEKDELQLSVIRRISRPRGFRLNPNPNMSDSSLIRYGNPDLNPEKTISTELNYMHTTDAGHVYTASVYYKFTDDVIDTYSWVDGKAVKQTYANMNSSHSAGLELIAKNKFKYLTLTTNLNGYYHKLVGGTFDADVKMDDGTIQVQTITLKKRSGFSWNVKEGIDFRLPLDITGQLSANYRSGRVTAQGQTKGQFSLDFGLKRSFLNKKISVSFSIKDITNSRNNTNETFNTNFYQKSKMTRNSRTFALNASYSFGTGNSNKKNKKDGGVDDGDMSFDDF